MIDGHVSRPAQGRFDEFIVRWIDEYRDREMRIFFAQVLAFAEVNSVVASLRDDINEMFFQETLARVAALLPEVGESELRPRARLRLLSPCGS